MMMVEDSGSLAIQERLMADRSDVERFLNVAQRQRPTSTEMVQEVKRRYGRPSQLGYHLDSFGQESPDWIEAGGNSAVN